MHVAEREWGYAEAAGLDREATVTEAQERLDALKDQASPYYQAILQQMKQDGLTFELSPVNTRRLGNPVFYVNLPDGQPLRCRRERWQMELRGQPFEEIPGYGPAFAASTTCRHYTHSSKSAEMLLLEVDRDSGSAKVLLQDHEGQVRPLTL
ncbi:MAG: hypothetical protein HY319_15590 [Armatimonadetes bacterium]|nr:hypothetical protein [Armatimonadota bacterium]